MARKEITSIFKLDLPQPTQELICTVRDFSAQVKLDSIDPAHLLTFHGSEINYANYTFARSEQVDQIAKQQYQDFFPDSDIFTIVAVMKNIKSVPACITPHIDSRRSWAMNYYIDLGGDHVVTSFYDAINSADPTQGQQYTYDQVKKINEYVFEANQWYAFNANQCHSVENIQTTRLALMLVKENDTGNGDITDLLEKNTHIKAHKIN